MTPSGRGLMWAVLRERLPLFCVVLAAALVFALLLYGCGSVEGPCDMDECNLECLEGDYALGSCVEDRCRCVPAWRGDGGPDGGDVDVDVDSDADTDSDTDEGPCGWDTPDLDCDGRIDGICIGPETDNPHASEEEPGAGFTLFAHVSTDQTCDDAGIDTFQTTAVGYPDWWHGGGSCSAWISPPDYTMEFPVSKLLPGCYVIQTVALQTRPITKPIMVGYAFVNIPDDELAVMELYPCEGETCPY